MKGKTIQELFDKCSLPEKDKPGRILLQSKSAVNTFFIPWYKQRDKWFGETRWYGNNNSSVNLSTKLKKSKIWIYVDKIKILPYNHDVRLELEKQLKKQIQREERQKYYKLKYDTN